MGRLLSSKTGKGDEEAGMISLSTKTEGKENLKSKKASAIQQAGCEEKNYPFKPTPRQSGHVHSGTAGQGEKRDKKSRYRFDRNASSERDRQRRKKNPQPAATTSEEIAGEHSFKALGEKEETKNRTGKDKNQNTGGQS